MISSPEQIAPHFKAGREQAAKLTASLLQCNKLASTGSPVQVDWNALTRGLNERFERPEFGLKLLTLGPALGALFGAADAPKGYVVQHGIRGAGTAAGAAAGALLGGSLGAGVGKGGTPQQELAYRLLGGGLGMVGGAGLGASAFGPDPAQVEKEKTADFDADYARGQLESPNFGESLVAGAPLAGALLGIAKAPKDYRLQHGLRGGIHGLGAGVGALVGGMAGRHIQSQYAPDIASKAKLLAMVLGGGIGSLSGLGLTSAVLGKDPAELDKEKAAGCGGGMAKPKKMKPKAMKKAELVPSHAPGEFGPGLSSTPGTGLPNNAEADLEGIDFSGIAPPAGGSMFGKLPSWALPAMLGAGGMAGLVYMMNRRKQDEEEQQQQQHPYVVGQ